MLTLAFKPAFLPLQTTAVLVACLASGQAAAAFPASVSLSSLDGSNGSRADGVLTGDFLGYSVSKIGDFNGDGRDDFILGAPNGGTLPGSAYVIYGSAGGLSFPLNLAALSTSNEGFRIDGWAANSQLGTAVADAGDLNGDGLADLIVGAPGEGAAYLFFGKAGGYAGTVDISILNGSNGFRISGDPVSQLGYSVANAGDVNGDGINDIIVGKGSPNTGVAAVIFGAHAFAPVIDISGLNGSNGFNIDGASINVYSFVVSGAGDINADGMADIAVGTGGNSRAYIIFGKNTGFTASISLTGLDGSNGVTLTDGSVSSNLGSAIAGIGDINADGIADLAVGAPMASTNSSNNQAGKTYVVLGSNAAFAATMNVATFNGNNGGFQIYGAATRDRSGWSVAPAGDINGDGIADLAIGAPFSSYSGTVSGTSYVIFGKSGAFSSPVLLTGNPAFINHLDGSNGFQLTGASSAEQSGWAVAGAGDINGDGADDLLVGARLASGFDGTSVLTNSGKVYVFYGQSSDRLAPVTSLSRTPAANPFGWNNASVAISLAATDETGGSGLLETRCVSDPLAIPAGFNDLPISACGPISFTSEGAHSFYAASVDRAGNQETPVSLAVKIDLTAPVVGVTGVKQGAVYRRGRVPATGCSTRDALSGVASNAVLTVTGGNSRGLGQFTASCSGALDQANNQGSAVVTYSVR